MSNNNFWHKLTPGFSCLAPMADVTDAAFREMFATHGRPDVMWTEFVSADGLFLAPEQGREFWLPKELRTIAAEHGIASDNPLLKDLIFSENESPIVAQFFSRDPDRMRRSAELAVALGFDGIDINMGCPARVIVNQGAGCAMIRDPETAIQVINATIEGANGKIPVSVKTRTGFNRDDEREDWLTKLLNTDIACLSLHARTRKDMSKVPARWENISYLVELRDKINPDIRIVGNGDIADLSEIKQKVLETGCDGVMVGRGIFGNPWFFNHEVNKSELSDKVILSAIIQHVELFDRYLGDTKNFSLMKKHFKSYLRDTDLSKADKQEFMEVKNAEEVYRLIDKFSIVG